MQVPTVWQNKTNRTLLAMMIVGILIVSVVFGYFYLYDDAAYMKIKDPVIVDALEVDKMDLQKSQYVTLYNFCLDEDHFWYKTDNSSSTIDAYYFFLNNQCYPNDDAVIVMEMDESVYRQFANETDSTKLVDNIFSGRLFKGMVTEYTVDSDLRKELKNGNVYTFKAGLTPTAAKHENYMNLWKILGVGGLNILLFAVFIYINQRAILRAYEKSQIKPKDSPPGPFIH